jgi:hypothetical protein
MASVVSMSEAFGIILEVSDFSRTVPNKNEHFENGA